MNEAGFLLSLGMRVSERRAGLAAPPIVRNIYREAQKWTNDSELDGLVRIKGTTYDEAKP